MRRRFALLTPLVLSLAFVLPTTAVGAAAFTHDVMINTCSPNGGANGYGKNHFKVRMWEHGLTGVTKLSIDSKAQRKVGNSWQTARTFAREAWHVYQDAGDSYLVHWQKYDPTTTGLHRFQFTLKWWDGNVVLKSQKVTGLAC